MSQSSNTSFLKKIKEKAAAVVSPQQGQIVVIPVDAHAFSCPNHFAKDNKGRIVKQKVVITFTSREKERTCECGTIYKKGNS